jgi:hypothetical protein
MTRTTRHSAYLPTPTPEERQVLLLLRVAIALAAWHRHQAVEQTDLEQAARLLARRAAQRELQPIDVKLMIA